MPLQRIANTDIQTATTFAFSNTAMSGNLTFTGTGNRIIGDFSNGTHANRVLFQTSTTNGSTIVGFLPNGTGVTGQLNTYNNSDPNNASLLQLLSSSTATTIGSGQTGTGSFLPLTLNTGGSERVRIANTGRVGIATTTPQTTLDVFGTIQANSVTVTANTVVPDLKAFQVTSPDRHTIRPSLLLDFANAKVLDPRITFTRASTGTYYDGKTVAKAEENLVQRSQEFDNVYWADKTRITVTANANTAPDGTNTADAIYETATTGGHWCGSEMLSFISGQAYTFSFYAKNITGGRGYVNIIGFGAFTEGSYAQFNLNTGAVGTTSNMTASIVDAGNGWYRCIATATATSTTSERFYVVLSDGTSTQLPSYAGDATKGIFAWGAQLEQRSSVTAYTATTTAPITNYIPVLLTAAANIPRFEHNPVTGESLGLEIEEQRTNLLTYSEDLSDASWTKTRCSVTANTIIAPNGTLSGNKLIENTDNNTHILIKSSTIGGSVDSSTYSVSIHAKAGERTRIRMFDNNQVTSGDTYFDLSAGTIISGSGRIQSVGNGWYRCTIFPIKDFSTNSVLYVTLISTGQTVSYTGNGFSGAYLWGAQVETGAFATSYIPTVASQVARAADSATMTGTNFSSWYRADEGTFYTEASSAPAASASNYFVMTANLPGNNNNELTFYFQASTNKPSYFGSNGSQANQWSIVAASGASFGVSTKMSGTYKLNDIAFSSNAATVLTDTSAIPSGLVNQLLIGAYTASSQLLNGTIKKIAFYPKRLTNAELQGLTTI